MARPSTGKWVQDKTYVLEGREDCYIYKRPGSEVWQYYLSIPGEGEERKSTKCKLKEDALSFALDRKLEVMSRHRQGLKARTVKKLFEFIDEFLDQERKRISPYNKRGFITKETFRIKQHHLNLLKKFYKGRSIKLEELDYSKLYEYPSWRKTTKCPKEDPIAIIPPETSHTILAELTTIRAYFSYLHRKGLIPAEPKFEKIQRESLRVLRRDYLNAREYTQTINTVRSWCNERNLTPSQKYNRAMIYHGILIMSNSCIRIGELKGLVWSDIEPNPNLDKEQQKYGHLIRIRENNTKTGEPRTVQSSTTKRFEELRLLQNIPKSKGPFPSVPAEFKNQLIFTKFRHPDQPLGQGTWDRCWKEIKHLCEDKYWNGKKISWYSFRHSGISFAVSRGVPTLQLARNCGTGSRYIDLVYYHHEAESRATWETLTKNRRFKDKMDELKDTLSIELEEVLNLNGDT